MYTTGARLPQPEDEHADCIRSLDDVPTIKLMAAAWAGLIRESKTTAADEVERVGKMAYGDDTFMGAMAEAVSAGDDGGANGGTGGGPPPGIPFKLL
ncbi:hypothetical protein LTR36_000552 [Oleoguttula mirabilis]|uniref:Uncharacterized protein n=1 Tax=Oleoguttula mirabilis TaxID=1507867 RepID=A0AAV9JRH8_9PEZI|nr:hypothetical protein LTR36_000552 [Oleoguttula mirabilis]